MRVFVTGAVGFIGRAVVQELLGNGHQVLGLARNEASAESVRKAGGEPHMGDLEDPDSLARGAKAADGVIHLAFIHDFKDFARPTVVDRAAIQAMSKALAGTGKPLVIATGTLSLEDGTLATEHSTPTSKGPFALRTQSPKLLREMSKTTGFRGIEVRLSPTVHDKEDWGFVPILMGAARKNGFVAYVDEGRNVWPAVHRLDAAVLFRLALEKGVDGASYHGVAEQGIASKGLMTVIGKKLGLPAKSVSLEEATAALGHFAQAVSMSYPTSSEWTQSQLGWHPSQVGLLEDIEKNYST